MALILNIETSGEPCSVALALDGELITLEEVRQPRAHSSQITPLVHSALKSAGYAYSDVNAIAISSGPGSYTGIRIGLSVAKALCFVKNLPLIAINTLKAVANGSPKRTGPVAVGLYARLDQYHFAVFDHNLTSLHPYAILHEAEIQSYLSKNPHFLITDNLATLTNKHQLIPFKLSASNFIDLSYASYRASEFVNLISFQSSYLEVTEGVN